MNEGREYPQPELVEEVMLNRDAITCHRHPGRMRGFARYRIEYGFECGCPEGTIYVPPGMRDELQVFLCYIDHR